MSEVFVSYARSSEAQAKQVSEALRSSGYGVWLDDDLPAHRSYSDVIEEQLKSAKAVVVIWSADAAKSQWVRAEADAAREAGTLVQVSMDGSVPPMPFNQIHCANLGDWDGDVDAPGWRKVAGSISSLAGPRTSAATEMPSTSRIEPAVNSRNGPKTDVRNRGRSVLSGLQQLRQSCLEPGAVEIVDVMILAVEQVEDIDERPDPPPFASRAQTIGSSRRNVRYGWKVDIGVLKPLVLQELIADVAPRVGPNVSIRVDKQLQMSPRSSAVELARDVLQNMSEAYSLLDRDFVVIDLNAAALALHGRQFEEVVGKSAWELAPDLESTEIGAALQRVMRTREAESLTFLQRWPDERSAWLDVRLLPVEAGLALFYRDVSAEIEQANQLEATSQRLDAILGNTTMAVFLMDNRQQCVYANSGAEKLTGYRFDQMQGRALHDVVHHKRPDGSHYPLEECPIDRAFPDRMQVQGEELFVAPDGSFYPVVFTASPLLDPEGKPVGTVIEARNIADEKAKERQLEAQARTLETINETGKAIAAELDLERVVQIVTDAAAELTDAQFCAFFYNVIDNTGEKLLLYTLSGARREDFERFGMPRATAIFHPTFVGEGVVRSDDIKKDPRYGLNAPHGGMPEGHLPVSSYLAVPVQSRSGEVIGGLFLGHPEEARFDEQHEHLMTGVAAQAAIAIDNARLFQAAQGQLEDRRRAEASLLELNETLETRVQSALADRQRAEDALRQAQKMEAVGQLTGGIAHDFNNLLTVVTGNIDMAARSLAATGAQDVRAQRALENAMKGAERAASLTQRLLAFSRRQPLAPKAIDVDKLVIGMSDLLNRSLGETVKLEIVTSPGLWRVEADPNQLESAILNLAVNARDAMPQGGELVIETANARLDEEYCAAHAEVAPGQYVLIAVTDTGQGMPKHIQERVFEPFYTTKDPGKGTGLGLSMVYGFVKQSGGHIKVYSEEEQGTTIKIYLPRLLTETGAEDESEQTPGIEMSPSAETVLVVEDDDDVRAYTLECLRELGYRVLEAHDGPSALRLLKRLSEPVDLLFTDVVMPGMSGRELADEARAHEPSLKVLYTSGYTRNAIVHGGRLDAGVEMIAKPFTYSALGQKIRDVLDAGRTGRVLVVEGEPTVRSLAMELLVGGGYSVDEAGNATEALSKVRTAQGRYDAIFIAEVLADNRGHSVVAEIRKLHADMPALIAAENELVEELTQLTKDDRCTGVIGKPYTGIKLVEALTKLGVRCVRR